MKTYYALVVDVFRKMFSAPFAFPSFVWGLFKRVFKYVWLSLFEKSLLQRSIDKSWLYITSTNAYMYLKIITLRVKHSLNIFFEKALVKGFFKVVRKELSYIIYGTLLFLYFYHFRGKYIVKTKEQKLAVEDLLKKYDRKMKDLIREQVKIKVFDNPDMPPKISPLLVGLVQQPRIQKLMTDLFVMLLHN